MDGTEKTCPAEQRALKKAARRAAFIQEIAEAVWAMRPTVNHKAIEEAGERAVVEAQLLAEARIAAHPLLGARKN